MMSLSSRIPYRSIASSSPPMIFGQAVGSRSPAAPTSTAVAPASIISITSSAPETPPQPMSGTFTASYTCHTARRAMGQIPDPESPPVVFLSTGRRVRRSMRMALTVLMRQSPSAPAPSQALAISVMSVTFGVSFMMTGFSVTFRTAAVTAAACPGSVPKLMPPPCTLGQLMFTSSQPTDASSASIAQVSAYSSTEKPLTFASTGLWNRSRSAGSSSASTFSAPGF